MSSPYKKQTIICKVDIGNPLAAFVVVNNGGVPVKWAHAGFRLQIGLYENGSIIDATRMADFSTIRLRIFDASRTGAAYMDQTVIAANLTLDVLEADFLDGDACHVAFDFTGDESALPVMTGQLQTEFWALVTASTSDDPTDEDVLAGSKFIAMRDADESAPSIVAGNAVPSGATYDGSGHYVLTLTVDRTYQMTQGANDTSITNGSQTVTGASSAFITQGSSVTLNGTAGQPVTYIVQNAGTLTPDEMDARYSRGTGTSSGAVGVVSLTNGVSQVTISGLALGFTPVGVVCSIQTPSGGGLVIKAAVDAGSISTSGFTAYFDGKTDSGNYKFSYFIF